MLAYLLSIGLSITTILLVVFLSRRRAAKDIIADQKYERLDAKLNMVDLKVGVIEKLLRDQFHVNPT